MGRTGLPRSAQTAAAAGWAFLFAAHVVRLLVASYWLGIRKVNGPTRAGLDGAAQRESGVEVATQLTTDVEYTLRVAYNAVSAKVEEQLRRRLTEPGSETPSWEHPAAYDRLMDLTWWDGSHVDWVARWSDPRFPLPAPLRDAWRQVRRRAPTVAQIRRARGRPDV
jgi:hypothetical protein